MFKGCALRAGVCLGMAFAATAVVIAQAPNGGASGPVLGIVEIPWFSEAALTLRAGPNENARVAATISSLDATQDAVGDHVRRAAQRAQVTKSGVHRLRHTFCSHLAMCGAPARAIQELAGHQDLSTTQRYMHVSPAAIDNAIRLLESPGVVRSCGDIVETGSTETANSSR